ncbi:MAG: M23 family metallopeptidase [Nitrospira sp. SB0677_bin_15]|nr:M23 family metallopeptidase [Nitrospira sp. SB0677_bin_15]
MPFPVFLFRATVRPWLVALVLVLASVFPISLLFKEGPQYSVGADGQVSGKQGKVVLVTIPVKDRPDRVNGRFLKRTLTFFPVEEQTYAGLLGLDMQDHPGRYELTIDVVYPQRTERRSLTVLVMKEEYPEQRLTLPSKMVDLDKKTLARVKTESKAVHEAFASFVPHPLWKGRFVEPVRGKISGRFGSRRVINGQPRKPHSGEDIAAPKGTPVVAMNDGIVRLTADQFFSGKGVIVDHGVGLFSMYFHLSSVDVEHGQVVKKGQVIGKVGSTGRATGPHLHWGVRLNGSRVDPYSLLAVSVDVQS